MGCVCLRVDHEALLRLRANPINLSTLVRVKGKTTTDADRGRATRRSRGGHHFHAGDHGWGGVACMARSSHVHALLRDGGDNRFSSPLSRIRGLLGAVAALNDVS